MGYQAFKSDEVFNYRYIIQQKVELSKNVKKSNNCENIFFVEFSKAGNTFHIVILQTVAKLPSKGRLQKPRILIQSRTFNSESGNLNLA